MSNPSYYMNMFGMKCCDGQLEKVPFARLELCEHVTMKTSQAFGLIGAGIAAPIASVAAGQRDFASIQDRSFRYGKNGIIAGLVVGPLITAAFLPRKSYDSIVDRCFRIRMNKGQMRADKFSILGVIAGVGAAHYLGDALERGAVFGFIGGFFVGTALNFC